MGDDLDHINYSALHNQAYAQIIKALRSGRFRPGDTLRTRTLAKALGVSSTPVREALSRLIAQNALDVDPRNRTAIIPPITRELLEELYDIRLLLECRAVELAAQRITQPEVVKLQTMAARLAKSEAEHKFQEAAYLDLSEQFYFAMYFAARQPLLVGLIESLWLRSSSILSLLHRNQPENFSLVPIRKELLDALGKHDAQAARGWMTTLVIATRDMVLRNLNEDELAAEPAKTKRSRKSARPQAGTLDAHPERAQAEAKEDRAKR